MITLRHCLAVIFLLVLCQVQQAQTTVTFKPGPAVGQDAVLQWNRNCPAWQTTNYGNFAEVNALAWTWNNIGCGTGGTRSLLRFDELNNIPAGSVIESAQLRLFGVPTSGLSNGNSSYPGGGFSSNASMLSRVVAPWNETNVTWNTQPATTTTGEVLLAASTAQWNYNISADVTAMVQAMVATPNSNHGFLFRLQTEAIYRSIIFASSDHSNAALWPELRISYRTSCTSTNIQQSSSSADPALYTFKAVDTTAGFTYTWLFNNTDSAQGSIIQRRLATGSNRICLKSFNAVTGVTCNKCIDICVQAPSQDTCIARFTSAALNPYTFQFTGQPVSFVPVSSASWDYGDGTTGTGWAQTEHAYERSGRYNVCLTLRYINGCTARFCDTVRVVVPCAVSFGQNTFDGYTYNFTGIPSGVSPVVNALWEFGDGVTSTAWTQTSHTYSAPGTYSACLTVNYANGCTQRYCADVAVGCKVDFNWRTRDGFDYIFTGTGTPGLEVTSAIWDFGNGTSTSGWPIVVGSFVQGTYKVCLKVTYSNGCVTRTCKILEIDRQIEPPFQKAGKATGSTVLRIQPNPVNTQELRATLSSSSATVMQYRVLDAAGKPIQTGRQQVRKGLQTLILPVGTLRPGKYFLELNGSQGGLRSGFIKL